MTSAVEKLKAQLGALPSVGEGASMAAVIQHPAAEKAVGKIAVPGDVLADTETKASQSGADDGARKLNQAMDMLKASCFEDQFGEFNIRTSIGRRMETVNIESGAGMDAIRGGILHQTGKLPPKSHLENIQALLRIEARSVGRRRVVHLRIASHEGARVLDLGDGGGHCVLARAGCWEVAQDSGVAFLRGRGYGALPIPVKAAGPRAAYEIVHEWVLSLGIVESKADLVVVALVSWLRTGNTYPLLLLYGPPGSGKSTAARLILLLIDPTESLALPNVGMDVEHIAAAAQHRHVISFDNVSKLSAAHQDTLCTCSTGGEIIGRKLYSNGDVAILPTHRPVLMTSVQPVITRPDLMSRSISIEFAQRTARQSEESVMAEFMARRPVLLGALIELLAAAE